jgi:hypothetical protein
MNKRILDIFCGVGGWTKGFQRHGWNCTGVDLHPFPYPGEFIQADALTLTPEFLNQFDAVVMSPPCEEFARAWLPWLRGDHKPASWAVKLLKWSVANCDRPRRIVECSHFSTHHMPGARKVGSYALWGDIPPDVPIIRGKMKKTGLRPDLRAEIPLELAESVARHFSR